YMLVYLVMAFYVARWNRGVLPLAAALAIILGIFAAIAGPEWFDRDKSGVTSPALNESVVGLVTLIIIPVRLLLIAFSMRGFQRAVGKQQPELLAPVAGEQVAGAEHLAPGGGHLLEQAVARLVAALVVVLLEVVEVEHRHAQRALLAAGARQLAGEVLVPGPAVGQAGEVVRAGDRLQAGQQVGALDRHRRLRRQQRHERKVELLDLRARDRRRDQLLALGIGLEQDRHLGRPQLPRGLADRRAGGVGVGHAGQVAGHLRDPSDVLGVLAHRPVGALAV